ncbi:hypothetical protein OUZ56_032253 [Daphnia magna]|uniref:Uncharacterized protein n=1 Tax=Daphnia magna TaxID=35525 RepID=A0ABQ9ZWX5_9CRUS|nr:hypothetical protein OUZ56_032253 [Daphnia magna]
MYRSRRPERKNTPGRNSALATQHPILVYTEILHGAHEVVKSASELLYVHKYQLNLGRRGVPYRLSWVHRKVEGFAPTTLGEIIYIAILVSCTGTEGTEGLPETR